VNRGGWTPLCYATFFGFANIADLLLDHGKADVNGRALNAVTPLMWASACSNNESIVQSMVSARQSSLMPTPRGSASFQRTPGTQTPRVH
jgi:ankyrin repeat protein